MCVWGVVEHCVYDTRERNRESKRERERWVITQCVYEECVCVRGR